MSATYDSTSGSESTKGRSTSRSFGEQSSRVADEVQELGRVGLASASEAASTLKERGARALELGREKAQAAKGKFEDVVSENPIKSVLIAVGVGVLLGYALRRRS
jgi:ElaB/YqjD/DUF883 family membrane-anchored ribosome-binding protein